MLAHTHTYAHMHACTHARARTHSHTHTHAHTHLGGVVLQVGLQVAPRSGEQGLAGVMPQLGIGPQGVRHILSVVLLQVLKMKQAVQLCYNAKLAD